MLYHVQVPAGFRGATTALSLSGKLGDIRGIANTTNNLALVMHEQRDFAAARTLHDKSLACECALGSKAGIAALLNNLDNVARDEGDYSAARELLEESVALKQELGDRRNVAFSLNNLAYAASGAGDVARARALFVESLTLRGDLLDKRGIASSLEGLARVVGACGDVRSASPQLGAAEGLREQIGARRYTADHASYARDLNLVRGLLQRQMLPRSGRPAARCRWSRPLRLRWRKEQLADTLP